ncbi:MCE family protein [Nocardia cyriacigeorgica]|uniref:MCE family protein n=1 Tax=Nocardia cyriacigeorgica TaxID=135487 RepID=A0A5R8P0G5_9NOCA|nr:MCE family protein [Nocardia cyriacigeorgica]TLF82679.1 MCE family protein [Nocardia cyriacigeorgica]
MVNTKTSGRSSGLAARLRGPLGLKLAGLGLVLFMVAVVTVSMIMFVGGFNQTVAVAVKAPRSGLVLDPDAKVKVRGVEIGRVSDIELGDDGATINLALNPDQLKLVPANAGVDIRSTTVFGAKYVNFTVPEEPSSESLKPGATVAASKVTVEFNTLFQHLSDVLAQVEPEKLNATLAGLGTALQGRGEKLGDLLVNSEAYLRDINPSLPTLQRDLATTAQVTTIYADTVGDLLRTVDNAIVTSGTIVDETAGVDELLANLTGLADTVGSAMRENEQPLVTAMELLRPTSELLYEYRPALSCLILGLGKALPLGEAVFGGLQPGVGLNSSFMYGQTAYTYPEDLPKVNATGGPRCAGTVDREPGSHADYVVTDTSEGAPYAPSTQLTINAPKVFQILFAGLPGVRQP